MATRKDFHTWTPADDERALALHEDDLGYDDIAIEMGITPGSVRARLEKLRYAGRTKAEPLRFTGRELYRDCMKCASDVLEFMSSSRGAKKR